MAKKVGRPSKINKFIEVAKEVLFKESLMLLTDKDVINILSKNGVKICKRTFQRYKSKGLLTELGINPNEKELKSRGIKFENQSQYQKEYYHKVARFQRSATSLLSYHLRKNDKKRTKKTFEYFGYSESEYIKTLKSKLKEGMTLDNYGLWHVDHIKPLSKFDLTKDEEIKKAWAFDNLQCLWASENISKGNRYEESR